MGELEEVSVIDRTRLGTTTETLNPNFIMQPQCHSYWCWAAVTSSVSGFYDETSAFTQCRTANIELERQDCCDFDCGTPNLEFDVMHVLGSPLKSSRLPRPIGARRSSDTNGGAAGGQRRPAPLCSHGLVRRWCAFPRDRWIYAGHRQFGP